jgi:hypothetical protein
MASVTPASSLLAERGSRHIEDLAVLADEVLAGEPACLYDPECHEGPENPDSEPAADRAARERVAAEVCAACPVREPCLEYALHARPARGVWAGLTAFEVVALADALGIESLGGGARLQPPGAQPGAVSAASHLAGDHPGMPAAPGGAGPAPTPAAVTP